MPRPTSPTAQVGDAIRETAGKLGPVDLLVANAGVGAPTLIAPMNVPDVEKMYRVNVFGVIYAIEAVLPEMLQRKKGHLAAVSSMAAYKGLPGESGYSSSKAAVNTFMEGLRIQLRDKGIAVTTICPGFVKTPMTEVNDFDMPWLLEADDAARRIVRSAAAQEEGVQLPLADGRADGDHALAAGLGRGSRHAEVQRQPAVSQDADLTGRGCAKRASTICGSRPRDKVRPGDCPDVGDLVVLQAKVNEPGHPRGTARASMTGSPISAFPSSRINARKKEYTGVSLMLALARTRTLFVAVGENGLRMASADGVAWKHLQSGKEGEVYRAVCFGDGRFVALGTYGGDNLFSVTTDGATWQTIKRQNSIGNVRGISHGKDLFLAVGGDAGFGTYAQPCGTISKDGLKWSDFFRFPGKSILRRTAFGNGKFVGVGDSGRAPSQPMGGSGLTRRTSRQSTPW